MKPRDILKLAVRILGLIFLYHGLMSVPVLFQGIYSSFRNAIGMIIAVGWPLVVAIALLGFAAKFTDFFYPKSEDGGPSAWDFCILRKSDSDSNKVCQ